MRIKFCEEPDGSMVYKSLIDLAIERMILMEPPEGYYLAFGGGKDSITLYHLAVASGVKFDAHYSPTTVDPPELVRYIKRNYQNRAARGLSGPDVQFEKIEHSMFEMIVKRGLPIRQGRWCCEEFKEKHGMGRVIMTGIRWAESVRRKNTRSMNESCYKTSRRFLHPIIDWSNEEVWEYIKEIAQLPYCSLYDEGFKRLGCVLCPMQTLEKKKRGLARFPSIAERYRKAVNRLYDRRVADGNESVKRWADGDAMFSWWVSNESSRKLSGQTNLFVYD